MKGEEIRQKFLEFFQQRGHRLVPSSSLVPRDDPSVLLTTAGMQQFKPYFAGTKDPFQDGHPSLGEPLGSRRIVTIQKCLRTSDIEKVGDNSHLTFFEMLGNFSFGDYGKKEAILWADEFLTEELKISRSKLQATYFGGEAKAKLPADGESKQILEGLGFEPKSGGKEDNFWGPTGDEGPCGPTVEFHAEGVELWNLVFNEYYCQKDGSLKKSSLKGVDTGAGLERIATFLQNKKSVYEIDLLKPLIELIAPRTPPAGRALADLRIAVDHLRASVFLLADQVRPSNKEQGYVLRRLLRRLFIKLDFLAASPLLKKLIENTIELYQNFYPELKSERESILQLALHEGIKFSRTLLAGNQAVDKLITQTSGKAVDGAKAFEIFASLGTPIDYIREKVREESLHLDEEAFEKAFKKHQEVSRAGRKEKFGGHGLSSGAKLSKEDKAKITRLHTATHLLHAALRKFLGEEVRQAGSDINPERTRFDFTFSRRLTEEEKEKIAAWVNQQIEGDLPVKKETLPYAEALKQGALAFFKEKYGVWVDVYTIGDEKTGEVISKEICGGPHVKRTSEIGRFYLFKEESPGSGLRRLRARIEP